MGSIEQRTLMRHVYARVWEEPNDKTYSLMFSDWSK